MVKKKPNVSIARILGKTTACETGRAWAYRYDTPADAWKACTRIDWLFWVFSRWPNLGLKKIHSCCIDLLVAHTKSLRLAANQRSSCDGLPADCRTIVDECDRILAVVATGSNNKLKKLSVLRKHTLNSLNRIGWAISYINKIKEKKWKRLDLVWAFSHANDNLIMASQSGSIASDTALSLGIIHKHFPTPPKFLTNKHVGQPC